MSTKLSICIAAALGIVTMPVFADNTSVTPIAGIAAVDGDISEWNINDGSPDFSANMCTAGSVGADGNCEGSGKELLSTMYSRYDCNTNTMYVMVLREGDNWPDKSADDAWVKIYDLAQTSQIENFSWVSPDGVEGSTLIGYEASFTLAAGTYNDVQVHLNVSGDTSSTGKKGDTMSITVGENCSVDPELTACDYVYGVHDRGLNDSRLFKYSADTGFVGLGKHDGADIEGLDISPAGEMYGSAGDNTRDAGAIYKIDMVTGEKNMIGDPSGYEIDGISFNPVTSELTGWAQDVGLLNIDPTTGVIDVIVSRSGEVEDISWNNDGTTLYFIESNHGGNDPDAANDNGVAQTLRSYTPVDGISETVCGIQGKEIEAIEVLQDNTLLVGYHNNKTQIVKIINPDSCEVILDSGVDGTHYNDIEGLAVCPPPVVIAQ